MLVLPEKLLVFLENFKNINVLKDFILTSLPFDPTNKTDRLK